MNTSIRTTVLASVLAMAAALPAVAFAASIEGSRDIARYQQAAMPAVSEMPYTQLSDWQALNGKTLAVWTANDKPWLLTLQDDCSGLMTSGGVGLTASNGKVTSGEDFVEIGTEKCKIAQIQPVDYKQVMAMHHHHHAGHVAKVEKTASPSGGK